MLQPLRDWHGSVARAFVRVGVAVRDARARAHKDASLERLASLLQQTDETQAREETVADVVDIVLTERLLKT
jgi:hypothetical protein